MDDGEENNFLNVWRRSVEKYGVQMPEHSGPPKSNHVNGYQHHFFTAEPSPYAPRTPTIEDRVAKELIAFKRMVALFFQAWNEDGSFDELTALEKRIARDMNVGIMHDGTPAWSLAVEALRIQAMPALPEPEVPVPAWRWPTIDEAGKSGVTSTT